MDLARFLLGISIRAVLQAKLKLSTAHVFVYVRGLILQTKKLRLVLVLKDVAKPLLNRLATEGGSAAQVRTRGFQDLSGPGPEPVEPHLTVWRRPWSPAPLRKETGNAAGAPPEPTEHPSRRLPVRRK